ncbi:hypothetical protein [Pseudoalteromonas gelatinilytica]|uniref:Uncharacterized protein n=1 Tax=Pseudoalteromonas gelatinilytica TaxID=1703256 RepID=A0ABQ1TBW3_9GAMM|nr:hypothetical protein [Pseudoalteromonas profundi]GGE91413.1 hypothetical protein GCM10008027_15350 [Pseudoalteromonas profundi]
MVLLLQKNIKRIFELGYIKKVFLKINGNNKIVLLFKDNNNSIFSISTHKYQDKQKEFVNFDSAVNTLEKLWVDRFSVINTRGKVNNGG